MIRVLMVLALLLTWGAGTVSAGDRAVVVELFTSQGCSSCPPADGFFESDLAPRDDVIALGLHVDYWDYIGWKDSFGSPQFSKRQKAYARAAGKRMVYTPQMIVGGRDHVIGTKPDEVRAHIRDHANRPARARIGLTRQGGTVSIRLEPVRGARAERAVVQLVRYTPQQTVDIKRGENAGRSLSYANIVTEWNQVGLWDMRETRTLDVSAPGRDAVVVIVQETGHGPILAAARLR